MGTAAVREDSKEAILDATDALFQRYGYRKTTVEDIAQESGICRGTVYLHFRNKEEIALSWLGRYNDRVRETMRGIAAEAAVSPSERVRRVLLARILVRFDNIQHLSVSLDEMFATMRPLILEHRQKCQANEGAIVTQVLEEGRAQGVFDFGDRSAANVAHSLMLATSSLLPYSLSTKQLGERPEIEQKARALVDLLLNGLHSRK